MRLKRLQLWYSNSAADKWDIEALDSIMFKYMASGTKKSFVIVQFLIIWAINIKMRSLIGKQTFYSNLDIVIKSDRIYGVLFDSGTSGSGEPFSWNTVSKGTRKWL